MKAALSKILASLVSLVTRYKLEKDKTHDVDHNFFIINDKSLLMPSKKSQVSPPGGGVGEAGGRIAQP